MTSPAGSPDPAEIIKRLKMEEQEGGLLFHLSGGIDLLVKYYTDKQLQVELWRNGETPAMLAPDTGNLYSSSFRQRLLSAAGQALIGSTEIGRGDLLKHLEEDLGLVATLMGQVGADGETLHSKLETSGRSLAERLVLYALESAEFFHTPSGKVYARARVNGHVEHYEVSPRSQEFKLWLRREFWTVERRRLEAAAEEAEGVLGSVTFQLPEAVRERVLTDALLQLQSHGRHDGPEFEVYRRIAGCEGDVYIDICDTERRVIEVTPEGRSIITSIEAPVRFERKAHMLALADPEEGGSVEPLRELLHLGDDEEGERNWRLVSAWLAHALTPNGPYSVLTLLGNQGSGKSVTQRILRNLIDPNTAPLRRKPREDRDLYTAAVSGWVISLNNLRRLPDWLSDALCAIADGDALALRQLYTDSTETILEAQRPVALNGITDIITSPDLLQRALIVRLPPFKGEEDDRYLKRETVYARADEIAPTVFGGLLDALVHYLAVKDDTPEPEGVRVSDFGVCAVATEEKLGGEVGSFLDAYRESIGEATAIVLESHPVAVPLIDFARKYAKWTAWEGTAALLLQALNDEHEEEPIRNAKDWPSSAAELGSQLSTLATDLQKSGVYIERPGRGHGGVRKLRITYKDPEKNEE
jgi:hypothetical protein